MLVDDNGTEYNTTMSAGHFSFTTNEEDRKVIRPSIDWSIELDKDFDIRIEKIPKFKPIED